ncbi:MAG: hypothetical protein U0R52_00215 [Solirubrobacterales bacterium]
MSALVLPLAHTGHWLWLLYVPPVAIVVFAIARTTLKERREARRESEEKGAGKGSGQGGP